MIFGEKPRGRPRGGPQGISARLDAYSMPVPECGCQIWFGKVDQKGYGSLAVGKRKKAKAHRLAWTLRHGPIPDGVQVLHSCDTPPCINVDHLFLGTNSDNVSDMVAKGRQATGAKNGASKLTNAAVSDIRSSAAAAAVMADKYGVSADLVRLVRRYQIWRHLP